jgi:hypothetical protein
MSAPMTSITEIASDVFRISTYVRESNIQFNQFLVRDEQPLLFHTGHKRLFPQVREAVATILVGTAALARVLAGLGVFDPQVLLVIASMAWSGAFALLLVFLVRLRTHTPAGMNAKASAHGR